MSQICYIGVHFTNPRIYCLSCDTAFVSVNTDPCPDCCNISSNLQYGTIFDCGKVIFIEFHKHMFSDLIIPKYGPDYIIKWLLENRDLREAYTTYPSYPSNDIIIHKVIDKEIYGIIRLRTYEYIYRVTDNCKKNSEYDRACQLFINRGGTPITFTVDTDETQKRQLASQLHPIISFTDTDIGEICINLSQIATFFTLADIRITDLKLRTCDFTDITFSI
jgi:hypothetical protein